MQHILITFSASLLLWFMYAGLLFLWLVDGRIKKEQVIHALIISFTAWVFAEILKQIIHTQRPFVINGLTPLTITIPGVNNGSFPSNHSATAFSLATAIWLHDRKIGWIYLFFALCIGTSRVLAYVHYPVDILGGALLGILTAFAFEKIHFFKLLRRGSPRAR